MNHKKLQTLLSKLAVVDVFKEVQTQNQHKSTDLQELYQISRKMILETYKLYVEKKQYEDPDASN